MARESNLVIKPETVFVKLRNRTQRLSFAVVGKTAEISQLLQKSITFLTDFVKKDFFDNI